MCHIDPSITRRPLPGGIEYAHADGRVSFADLGGAPSEFDALMSGRLMVVADPLGIWGDPTPAAAPDALPGFAAAQTMAAEVDAMVAREEQACESERKPLRMRLRVIRPLALPGGAQ